MHPPSAESRNRRPAQEACGATQGRHRAGGEEVRLHWKRRSGAGSIMLPVYWDMNMNIDIELILRISERLEGFQRKRPDLYNFRCPLCGDSQKYKAKRRGFFYAHFGRMKFKCHNCGVS